MANIIHLVWIVALSCIFQIYGYRHGLRTPREEIVFIARPKMHSHSQIFRYGRSIFCLPHQPNFSDIFDLCLHWVSIVRGCRWCFLKILNSQTACPSHLAPCLWLHCSENWRQHKNASRMFCAPTKVQLRWVQSAETGCLAAQDNLMVSILARAGY